MSKGHKERETKGNGMRGTMVCSSMWSEREKQLNRRGENESKTANCSEKNTLGLIKNKLGYIYKYYKYTQSKNIAYT